MKFICKKKKKYFTFFDTTYSFSTFFFFKSKVYCTVLIENLIHIALAVLFPIYQIVRLKY